MILPRGRRQMHGNRSQSWDIDETETMAIFQAKKDAAVKSDDSNIFLNDSEELIVRGKFYGRGSDGKLTTGNVNGSEEIPAEFMAAENGYPYRKFKADYTGSVMAAIDPSESPTMRGLAYLSASGLVTGTKTTPNWQVLGRFASTSIGPDNKIQIDLNIRPVAGGDL